MTEQGSFAKNLNTPFCIPTKQSIIKATGTTNIFVLTAKTNAGIKYINSAVSGVITNVANAEYGANVPNTYATKGMVNNCAENDTNILCTTHFVYRHCITGWFTHLG